MNTGTETPMLAQQLADDPVFPALTALGIKFVPALCIELERRLISF
jgi:hypothetical protein